MLGNKGILSFAVVVSLCILLVGLEARAVPTNSDVFPVQGGAYEWEGSVTYPGATIPGSSIDIELVSLSLTQKPNGAKPPVSPPPDGSKYEVDSFFDIYVKLEVDGATDFAVDSFFDITTELTIDNPTGGSSPEFIIEILSMDLVGEPEFAIPGTSSGLRIRLSPTISSVGWITIEDIDVNDFEIDSFFDVFTEISVDGGAWKPASGSIRTDLIPEPATLSLLALGGLALIRRRR